LHVFLVEEGEKWMTPYKRYLANGTLLLEPIEVRVVKKNAIKYTLVDGKLFRHGYAHPIM